MRTLYFEQNTDMVSLFWLPLIFGVVLAFVFPWAALFGTWMARFPKAKLHGVQFAEASRRRISEYQEKAREEEAKARFEAATEQRKIDAAKRLEEASGVSRELEEEINSDREEIIADEEEARRHKEQETRRQTEDWSKEILDFAANSPKGQFVSTKYAIHNLQGEELLLSNSSSSHRDFKDMMSVVQSLYRASLIERSGVTAEDGYEIYEITSKGYRKLEL